MIMRQSWLHIFMKACIRIYGPVPSEHVSRAALCLFNVENIHPTDIATFLDREYQVIIALNLSIDTWELMQVRVLVSTSTTQKKTLMHSLEP
ncbi:hypothetical protein IFM89_016839 [Coptis chinensis]|uniref:Uncharacterized protein n=1 Tax=Coptis chinensis TaxID=261450 RepID=A0A835GXV0_9MAGN|nr:hypothetical protein IFM89_016839 [Coptis chinensis]